jgi:hypothetical protein
MAGLWLSIVDGRVVVVLLSSSGRVRGSLVELTKADDDEVRDGGEGV